MGEGLEGSGTEGLMLLRWMAPAEVDRGSRTAAELWTGRPWVDEFCDLRELGPLIKITAEESSLKEQVVPLRVHLAQTGRTSSH
jgi:hypothetical protein